MISISNYLKDRTRESEAALRRAFALMLQLVELHAVEGDEVDYAQFRSGIQTIAGGFSNETSPEQVLIIVGQVASSLKEYAERTTRYRKAQAAEYQQMLGMLTETLSATTNASDRTVTRLQEIERKIERAAVIEDVRVLRMQLDECLGSIRDEIRCHEAQSAASSDSQASLAQGRPSAPIAVSYPETDPVTGLPGRHAAECALEEARTREGRWYAVAIVANRIASVNSRFGFAVGDRVLRRLSEQVRSGLSAEDRIFRWSGPCLVALLFRATPEHELRAELTRITSAHKDEVVEIGNRSVLLPTSAAWAIFPSNEPARITRDKIDQFVGSQCVAY